MSTSIVLLHAGPEETGSVAVPASVPALPTPAASYNENISPAIYKAVPLQLIDFNEGTSFVPNPLGSEDVALPPMPKSLSPFGPTLPKASTTPVPSDHPNDAKAAATDTQAPSSAPVQEAPKPTTNASAQNGSTELTTVSPFLEWLKVRQSEKSNGANSSSSDSAPNPASSNNPYVSVPFPYLGSQPAPPISGAVIYSTPER